MIGKAKSISHGINDIRYITGESRNKKHPERIYHIKDNLLPCRLDAQGVWDMMKAHAPTGKNVIRIEISPAKEHTEHFTLKDWEKLWDDFVREYDSMEFRNRQGEIYSHRTNLAGSISTVWLHLESKSGIPHLHAAVCRKDNEGRTNNDHNIHLRAQYAAERVARKRGWTTAMEIRRTNADEVAGELIDILRSMPSWSWDDYVARVRAKGYTLEERRDKKDVLRGYTVGIGDVIYKASELGKGRNLMASKIEATWNRLHNQSVTELKQNGNQVKTLAATTPEAKPETICDKPVIDYFAWREGTSRYELAHDGKDYRLYIPDNVMQLFDDEFDYRETANHKELADYAVALFVGMMSVPAVPSGGGGGTSNDLPWGRKEDEDEMERARRCARAAIKKFGKKSKSSIRR
ncbi:relaxase [Bacteroides ovatus]|uniref:Relaxase n=1 Tax=Bacteroides ovatus TaxID=28116 RepID=A0A413ESC9_BACOV|nr:MULTISPECIES: relaxase [Bacteroides]KAA4626702.1 relaxase [Bacteroides ovatus]KAA4637725.1 relaxase [Bacteroides ovatus]KAA4672521.1 relaxase [Bacteroides ovatus]KAA4681556.1 relaxase [Bacteroides ovatus]RGE81319.1 relaxase [Bacteroides sp. AF32-8BH]